MNDVTGSLKVIGETTEYGANNFRKREFVLTTDGKYPQDIKLELYQDDCALIEAYSEGDQLCASFNIRGNEYKGKYYVNLQAWKLDGEPSEKESESTAAPKKRGRPRKKPEPTAESQEDLTENISELADAPF